MHPIVFKLPEWLGGFDIPAYGILAAAGMLVGAMVFGLLAQRLGHDRSKAFEVALETILVGFVASKIVGIAFQPALGEVPFLQLVATTGGVWYVGFLSGVAYATWRFRNLGMPLRLTLDCAAVAVAAGHAFGRLGCYLAGCCWGGHCDAPWAVTFTSERAHALVGVPLNVPLHPVQLYEAGSEALTALLLGILIWRRAYRFHLQPGLLYLLIYGAVRFGLEFLRDDPRGDAGVLSPSQVIALSVIGVALPLYVLGMVRGTIIPWHPRVPGGDARSPPAKAPPAA